MFETLLRLWKENRLTETKLINSRTKGWITEEEFQIILNTEKDIL